jgi:hypothetical protein
MTVVLTQKVCYTEKNGTQPGFCCYGHYLRFGSLCAEKIKGHFISLILTSMDKAVQAFVAVDDSITRFETHS